MKRKTLAGLAASLVVAAVAALVSCSPSAENVWNGYMEGEFVRVSAPVAGQLMTLSVTRGANVAAGAPLFALEHESEAAAVAEAEARVSRAESQLENLRKGKRPVEMVMVRSQLAQAEANWTLSQANRERQEKLAVERTVSASALDDARAAESRERARVTELRAMVEQGAMGAREDEIGAAEADVIAARRARTQSIWRRDQKAQTAPAAGRVTETFFREGELVAAGTPVVEILPPENVKVRFFVPQEKIPSLPPGTAVRIRSDGGKAALGAKIIRIASQAEYTPPFIYSRQNRAHLVFLVEAKLDDPAQAALLPPGLPVEVSP